MSVKVTLSGPAEHQAAFQNVCNALGPQYQGMFRAFTKAGGEIGEEGDTPVIIVSSGFLPDDCPLFDRTAYDAAVAELGNTVDSADVDTFFDQADIQLPGTGKARLRELDQFLSEAAAQGLSVTWRDFDDSFGDDFA